MKEHFKLIVTLCLLSILVVLFLIYVELLKSNRLQNIIIEAIYNS